ncbi:LapA family protein [Calothrix sp. UHCC 0171]|uniref:LapA family protein n=1 Tax=Calothrix sp. UHCC 0171 TaxID=3110245 RepID=UPI002B1F1F4F|nr:LapA family protein [Calothrix sp. UHCC 0171]MEA5570598.1 LapA family protein [Calothrix sp. UHCC 0171]
MRILTLLALIIAIAAVTFALQNSAPVAVQFLGWRSLELSMALILLITFSFGVLFGFIVSLFPAIKNMRKRSELMRKIEQQTYENKELNRQLTEVSHQLQMLQPSQPQSQLPEDVSSNYSSDAYIE